MIAGLRTAVRADHRPAEQFQSTDVISALIGDRAGQVESIDVVRLDVQDTA